MTFKCAGFPRQAPLAPLRTARLATESSLALVFLRAQAEQQVQIQVAEQLEAIGGDRTRWPAVARREVEALDARVASLSAVVSAGQAASEEASAASHTASRIQVTCPAADQSRQRKLTAAKVELSEWLRRSFRRLLRGHLSVLTGVLTINSSYICT
jgi:hypothetical protein